MFIPRCLTGMDFTRKPQAHQWERAAIRFHTERGAGILGRIVAELGSSSSVHSDRATHQHHRSQVGDAELSHPVHNWLGSHYLGAERRYVDCGSCLYRHRWWSFLRCSSFVHWRNCAKGDSRHARLLLPAYGYDWYSFRLRGWRWRWCLLVKFHLRSHTARLRCRLFLHAR